MKKLVVLTGAGISAESGISTFRDAGGLWDEYPVMEVASHDGFVRNPAIDGTNISISASVDGITKSVMIPFVVGD